MAHDEAVSGMAEKTKDKRCAYCGGIGYYNPETEKRPSSYCDCSYRYMRMGASGFQIHNTNRSGTVADMRAEFEKYTSEMLQDVPVAWIFGVTRLSEDKIAKADAKREAVNGK